MNNPLAGQTILVVEDDPLIALDIADQLRDLGAGNVVVAESVANAIKALDADGFDIALLDVALQESNSTEVADRLLAGHIRFGFATGYTELTRLPEHLRHVPVISKPFTADQLRSFICDLISTPEGSGLAPRQS